jgi:hypothetical protein
LFCVLPPRWLRRPSSPDRAQPAVSGELGLGAQGERREHRGDKD